MTITHHIARRRAQMRIVGRAAWPCLAGLLCAGTLFVGAATAQGRPDTRDYTCRDARELVRREGAIVLSTGDHTYSRFVDHAGHCFRTEVTRPQFAPTADERQCFAGYRCVPRMLPSTR